MKKLNNKGYLLVEIIVAFSIATAFMYIISDITIRVKNRNDDLMVKMHATVDQTIIYNTVMYDVYKNDNDFSCSNYRSTYINNIYGIEYKYEYPDKADEKNIIFLSKYVNFASCSGNKNIILNVNNYGTFYVTPHSVNIKKYLNK